VAHFARFVGAQRVNVAGLHPEQIRTQVQATLCEQFEVTG
jgi:hypothetical protein